MNSKTPVNLGPKQKRKRFFLGILGFLAAGALAVYFVFEEFPVFFRLLVFPLFFLSMLGFLQAKERTCVVLACKKVRNLDSGEEPISDYEINKKLMQKTQKILLQAFLLSGALTLACLLS